MDATARASLRAQFGATMDMLENAVRACPDEFLFQIEIYRPCVMASLR